MKHEIRAGQENLLRTMEEMMKMNQAKTDVKLEELSAATGMSRSGLAWL
jgi:hypothetical protein